MFLYTLIGLRLQVMLWTEKIDRQADQATDEYRQIETIIDRSALSINQQNIKTKTSTLTRYQPYNKQTQYITININNKEHQTPQRQRQQKTNNLLDYMNE